MLTVLQSRSTMTGVLSQTTAVLTSGLERIPDQLGYLVISEDGVLAVSVRLLFVYRFFRFGEPASVDRLFEKIDQGLEGCGRPRPPSPHLWFSPQVSWRTMNTPRR